MGLDVPHRRPLARLAARGAMDRPAVGDLTGGSYAPPATVVTRGLEQVTAGVERLCLGILRAVLLGEDPSPLRGQLAPRLITWSPHLFTVSRDQLLTSLDAAELAGEMLTEETIEATNIDVADPRVYVEWRLTARFTSPGFVDDNLLVEPTGRLLETAGVLVVTFAGDQVVSAHCYYDDLALLEQLLTAR